MSSDPRRALPAVGTLLDAEAFRPLLERTPRSVVADAVRDVLDGARRGEVAAADGRADSWLPFVEEAVARRTRASLRPVINATGVVLHTNLGRAPLAGAAIEAMDAIARGYSNLEYDLAGGERGSRYTHCAGLLRELTGAEDALVVNNGAAALLLALNTLARGREAVVSRGELVEIGGSFRVPDIMAASGVTLVEVGTTNRTHAADYTRAIGAQTGALVKVHRSNFALEGFVADVSASELASLAASRGLPLIHDLGSGLMTELDTIGLRGEPTAREALAAGATVVTMSGDKLLGGPQAGLVLGTAAAIASMRKNPLLRTYRVDKLTLAALEATLALYRDPAVAMREIPALAMLGVTPDVLRVRAERVRDEVMRRLPHGTAAQVDIVDSEASVGGGAFPTARIASVALAITGVSASALEGRLRSGAPPVIARVADDRVLLDLRAVLPDEDATLAAAVSLALEALGA